jgi:hypothetical protein
MAGFTRTNGDAQPVFAIDVQNGPVAPSTAANGTTTNFIGPAFDFYGIDLSASVAPTDQLGVNEAIAQVLQSIEQLSTVMMYAVQPTANTTNMSVAIYPVGAYGATTAAGITALQAQIRALGTVNGYDLSGAVVTNVGFRLASTATSAS